MLYIIMSDENLHPHDKIAQSLQEHKDTGRPLKLSPTDIGSVIEHGQCPRYAKFTGDDAFTNTLFKNPSNSDDEETDGLAYLKGSMEILSKEGINFEDQIYKLLTEHMGVDTLYNLESMDSEESDDAVGSREFITRSSDKAIAHLEDTITHADELDDITIYGQFPVHEFIGEFSVAGLADLVCVIPTEEHTKVVVFDVKASWDQKVSQQLQAATYTKILRSKLTKTEGIEFEAGIIHKENYQFIEEPDLKDGFIEKYPRFDVSPREDDIERLLSDSGVIYQNVITDIDSPATTIEEARSVLEDISYQIDHNCESCPYRGTCFTTAIESFDISLLKISQGERDSLKNNGIHTLSDLIELIEQDKNSKWDYHIKNKHQSLVTDLEQNKGIQNVKEMAVTAKKIYRELDPDQSSGSLVSNDNQPKTIPTDTDWNEDRAIEVYLNVQQDYITDSVIQLNALITPTGANKDAVMAEKEITEIISDIPYDHENKRVDIESVKEYEQELLKTFSTKLFSHIEDISTHLFGGTGYIHFYTYSSYEQEALTESVRVYADEDETINALNELLSVRDLEVREQQLWTDIESEVTHTHHMDRLSSSLPSVYDKMRTDYNDDKYKTFKFLYEDETYNLHNTFYKDFFDYQSAYEFTPTKIDINKETQWGTPSVFDDDLLATESYSGSAIPLEYFWGLEQYNLQEYFESNDKKNGENNYSESLKPFMYHGSQGGSTDRITTKDISAFGIWTVRALKVIKEGIYNRGNHVDIKGVRKDSIELSEISSYSTFSHTFKDALLDYVQLEFVSNKNELMSEFEKSVEKRIRQGKSIPIVVTKVSKVNNQLEIEGELAYRSFSFENTDFIKSSLKYESGDYLNATQLIWDNGTPTAVTNKHTEEYDTYPATSGDIVNSPTVILDTLDTVSETVKLTHKTYQFNDNTTIRKKVFSHESDDDQNPLHVGDFLILDENLSTYHLSKGIEITKNLEENVLFKRLDDLLHQDEDTIITPFRKEYISDFLLELEEKAESTDSIHYPNDKQEKFIRDTSPVSLLQGPPGTGKTSGSLAPTILSRTESFEGYQLNGLITGPSNTSVDEVMEATYDLAVELGIDNKIQFTRLESSTYSPETELSGVEYISSKPAKRNFVKNLENSNISGKTNLVFATPTTARSSLLSSSNQELNATDKFFDLVVVDEASMLTLPDYLAAGIFVENHAQILISGDQRQMNPVQTHEWQEETRPSIQKYIPYLSTLNYMLFIRGNTIDKIGFPDKHIDQPYADIPLHQLERTYRCHQTVADFLQRWVYSQDGLNYNSQVTETLSGTETVSYTEGVDASIEEDSFVLITHSDTQSQESNIVEAQIMKSIRDALDKSNWTGSTGVVTPHSSQKGLARSIGVSDTADTVERFQGGERDVIMVSSTVSDPSFIRKEDDFLLNPNRINVAISRMKKKLIVIVPESVFNHIPDKTEVYNDSIIWNGLYETLVTEDNKKWSGTLTEFTNNKNSRDDVTVSLYTKE